MRNWILRGAGVGLVLLGLIAFVAPAQAGGWAVVTLDSKPETVRAGENLRLGFMVLQHGKTPIDAPYGQGATMQPYLSATNRETGEILRAEAIKEGPVGHFVVEVKFPERGTWDWKITPPPFAGTDLPTLTVLPALPVNNSISTPSPTSNGTILLVVLAGLVGAIALLMLLGRSKSFRRWPFVG